MFDPGDGSEQSALISVATVFYQRAWMAGTAGNLSCRDFGDPGAFWITASGKSKGALTKSDFLLLDVASGELLEDRQGSNRPSAETTIHQVIYRLFPEATACFHVHSVNASLVSDRFNGDIPLPALEMLKGLGIWEAQPQVKLPLFANLFNVAELAADIETRFRQRAPDVPALLVGYHGITVWGETLEQCFNRVEIVEFILSYLANR